MMRQPAALLPLDFESIDAPADVIGATTPDEWRRLRALPVRTYSCDPSHCCGLPHTVIAVAEPSVIRGLLQGCLYPDPFFFRRYEFRSVSSNELDRLLAAHLAA